MTRLLLFLTLAFAAFAHDIPWSTTDAKVEHVNLDWLSPLSLSAAGEMTLSIAGSETMHMTLGPHSAMSPQYRESGLFFGAKPAPHTARCVVEGVVSQPVVDGSRFGTVHGSFCGGEVHLSLIFDAETIVVHPASWTPHADTPHPPRRGMPGDHDLDKMREALLSTPLVAYDVALDTAHALRTKGPRTCGHSTSHSGRPHASKPVPVAFDDANLMLFTDPIGTAPAVPTSPVDPVHDPLRDMIPDHGRRLATCTAGTTLNGAARKNVELVVVADYSRVQALGTATFARNAEIAVEAARLYAAANWVKYTVNITLVGQHALSLGDPWEAPGCAVSGCSTGEVDSSVLLQRFAAWRQQAVQDGVLPQHDIAALFSNQDLEATTIGLAALNGMCNAPNTATINAMSGFSVSAGATLVAHEIGHTFGFLHVEDVSGCASGSASYIMSASTGTTPATTFASCSLEGLKTYFDGCPIGCTPGTSGCSGSYYGSASHPSCLENSPTTAYKTDPVCGDGLVEGSEECDCGGGNCTLRGDPCCDGATCLLRTTPTTATCSARLPCCDPSTCKPYPATIKRQCRAAASACDTADTCDGVQAECPTDTVVPTGSPCPSTAADVASPTRYDGACFAGSCSSTLAGCQARAQSYVCPARLPISGDAVCGTLACAATASGSCVAFNQPDGSGTVAASEGTRCDEVCDPRLGSCSRATQQCSGGTCTDSFALFRAWSAKQASWTAGEWGPCFGPRCQQWRSVVCVDTPTGAPLDQILPVDPNAADYGRACNTTAPASTREFRYQYSVGEWGECSSRCGNGTQNRTAQCIDTAVGQTPVAASLCDRVDMPALSRACRTQTCSNQPALDVEEWSACSAPCGSGTRSRTVTCRNGTAGVPVLLDLCGRACPNVQHNPADTCNTTSTVETASCNQAACPSYSTGNWSSCSVSCGPGFRTRTVDCTNATGGVAATACPGIPPRAVEGCQTRPCFAFNLTAWSECTAVSPAERPTPSSDLYVGKRTRTFGGQCLDANGTVVEHRIDTCQGPIPATEERCITPNEPKISPGSLPAATVWVVVAGGILAAFKRDV